MIKIQSNFNRGASTYNEQAIVQRQAAYYLADLIFKDHQETGRPIQSFLDVGAGTGFLTCALLEQLFPSSVTLNDISPTMLQLAKEKLPTDAKYHLGNAETAQFEGAPFDLIGSNFTIQWFESWQKGLDNLLKQTNTLAFSTLLHGTFQEWENAHQALGIPSGLRENPTFEALEKHLNGLTQCDVFKEQSTVTQTFDSAAKFVQHLKAIGANTARHGYEASHLGRVLKSLSGPFTVSYCVFYGIIKKK